MMELCLHSFNFLLLNLSLSINASLLLPNGLIPAAPTPFSLSAAAGKFPDTLSEQRINTFFGLQAFTHTHLLSLKPVMVQFRETVSH